MTKKPKFFFFLFILIYISTGYCTRVLSKGSVRNIIFNPYRSLPAILFPQREQIFTPLLVITGFLFTGGGGGEEEERRFHGLKRGFPGMDENLKFSAITRSSRIYRSSFYPFVPFGRYVTYVRIKI